MKWRPLNLLKLEQAFYQCCFNYFPCLLKVYEVLPTKIAMLAFFVLFLGICVLDSEGKKILLILKHFTFDTSLSSSSRKSMVCWISIHLRDISINNITCLKLLQSRVV